MTYQSPLAITISRQFGSGGALLGKQLSKNMKMLYFDREIFNNATEELGLLTGNLEWRDEKITSKWQTLINTLAYAGAAPYSLSELMMPTDKEVFKAESKIILDAANEKSTIFVGRCSSHVLQCHPRHISVFLHADMESCVQRVQELYSISANEAVKVIQSVNKSRARYIQTFTGLDMNDVRQYHLSIDTGVLGLKQTEKVICDYVSTRFGDVDFAHVEEQNKTKQG